MSIPVSKPLNCDDLILDWTVCQVSLVTNPQVPDEMVLSSMRKEQDPVIVRLGAFKTAQVSVLLYQMLCSLVLRYTVHG